MAAATLTGNRPVAVDGIVIDAPGLAGEVVVEGGGGAPRRDAADQVPPAIRRAMGRQSMRARRTVRVVGASDTEPVARVTRGEGGPARPTPIRVAVPKPRKGRAQVLLSRDENGITTWHFPRAVTRGDTFAPAGTDVFEVGRQASAPVRRGLAIGLPKILQVVTFPVAKAAGAVIKFKVQDWDRKNHPPQVRAYGADKSLRALTAADWDRLAAGPCLLFIHGTFDTITGCYTRLPPETLAELHRRYAGRVIAFDHPTLADSPADNARSFLEAVGDRKLQVDLVCHSRGGLVARSIVERPDGLSTVAPNVQVRTAILVGATTNGTQLADVDHWNKLIDRLTTMLSFAPLPAAVDIMESILGLVRGIAVETAHDLAGLDAMSPGRPFLAKLNKPVRVPAGTTYRVIDSNYEPADQNVAAFFDQAKDIGVFHGENDGMVAIDSIVGASLGAPFPVADASKFEAGDHVEHANYFGQPKTSEALRAWLKG